MLVKDLNNYVKFVFDMKDSEDGFVTSDITALKEFIKENSLKIGDIVETDGIKVKITDIQLKHIDENVRSNKYGFNLEESAMQGELKYSVITIVVIVEQLD